MSNEMILITGVLFFIVFVLPFLGIGLLPWALIELSRISSTGNSGFPPAKPYGESKRSHREGEALTLPEQQYMGLYSKCPDCGQKLAIKEDTHWIACSSCEAQFRSTWPPLTLLGTMAGWKPGSERFAFYAVRHVRRLRL